MDNTNSPIPQLPLPPVSRGWAIAGGIAMILLGFFALGDQLVSTAAVATFIGFILMFACAFQLIKVFTIGGWKSHLWYILVSIAYGMPPAVGSIGSSARVICGAAPRTVATCPNINAPPASCTRVEAPTRAPASPSLSSSDGPY